MNNKKKLVRHTPQHRMDIIPYLPLIILLILIIVGFIVLVVGQSPVSSGHEYGLI